MRFEIGQQVWTAQHGPVEKTIECPDCGGTGRLRVILHDNDEVSIDCVTCALGYERPKGYLTYWEKEPRAVFGTITGVEITAAGAEWRFNDYQIIQDEDVFDNEADAASRAAVKAAEATAEELKRVQRKHNDTRTWAWNASYHRRSIKEANERIAYHTACLNVAVLKAKAVKSGDLRDD